VKRVSKIELWERVAVFASITVMGAMKTPYAPDRDAILYGYL